MNNTTEIKDKVTVIDLTNLPDFLGESLEDKLTNLYKYMDASVCLHMTKHTYVRRTCDERLCVCRERDKEAECVERERKRLSVCVARERV